MTYDLISVGSISVDIYLIGRSFTFKDNRYQLALGGKYLADKLLFLTGGGGMNVAVGAANYHLKTALLGTIGKNYFQSLLVDRLKKKDIDYHLCDFVDNYINLSIILLKENGERTIIHYATANQKLFDHQISIKNISFSRAIYVGNLPDIKIEERIRLLKYAKKNQIITFLNLGVKDCRRSKTEIKELLNLADVLIINGHEFADLVKAPYKDIHLHQDVINWYIPFLKNQIVVITEGSKGSYGYYDGKVYHQPAIKPKILLDTTGAGDGYCAGFIAEYLGSKDLRKSMFSAAKYAAQILEKIGAN